MEQPNISSKFRNYILISLGLSLGSWLAQTCTPAPQQLAGKGSSNMLDNAVRQAKEESDFMNGK